jgi:putative spermidine/putrescine transport system substrate-binding protein
VALLNVPQIGVMDAAMGAEAMGKMTFKDKGDMTRKEIDQLIDFLIVKKKEGHFRAFWETFGQSVNLMVSGEVALQSMWSPAVTAVKAEGVPCVYASLKEGLRGWHGCLAISAKVKGKKLDQAYEYINWWLDGWAGAFVARQGYYMSVPDNVKKHLSAAEWDYWYMGKPAAKELFDPFGTPIVPKGEVRDGGSYWNRFKNIAVWNSLMDENDYLVKRWTEFLSA